MMRNCHIIITLVCMMLVSCFRQTHANTISPPNDSVSIDFNESLCLFTDRNLYAAGEKILFSAFIVNFPSSGEYDWSKVMYLELISANSNPVVQAKYPVTEMKK